MPRSIDQKKGEGQAVQKLEQFIATAPQPVRQGFEEKTVLAGQVVLRQGEKGKWVYLLREGEAAGQMTSPEGELRSVFSFRAPAILGEFELFSGEENYLAVTALTDCRLLRLSGPLFLEWMRRDFAFCCALISQLIEKTTTNNVAEDFLDRPAVRQRLERTVLRWYREGRLALLDKSMLCAEIGAPLRSVNRALAACRKEGLLEWKEGRLWIQDPDALADKLR